MNHDFPGKHITIISKNVNYYFNKKLEKYNIKRNQLQILHYLNKNKGVSQDELGKDLMMDKISVTKILKGLVSEQYVEKREGEKDKRRKELYITEKGYELHDEVYDITQEVTEILFRGFSYGEEQIARELLIRMSKNIYEAVQDSK
ncbi:DNA-binding transcriptional regulator, MarR family [Dethiosulfatibacter aminovorans DSM 17477]|uniref:DNA-binding transcriptional regulator, MarR family n=1 Tax=Dethiosulfatibacter aminovorans DSM 17477 TaxID=1121476 RepID=A0A1M6IHS4_9FIRM|nr:MarR family transcriptional regulator [Dethiosulfatibacter aminovorans]SHJ34011.1 DNA-binding transcriptional regulator, MarR family [Dethiosulfatibacter aminovorans DSM 17477]